MEILRALQKVESFEKAVKQLYDAFYKKFSEDKEAAGLFYTLSLEQKSHTELIQYQRRVIKKSSHDFQKVDIDSAEIKQCSEMIKDALSKKDEVSLEDAVKLTVLLENSEIKGYYRSLMEQANIEVSRLVMSFASDSQEHLSTLMSFALKNGWLSDGFEE